ncbi:PELP1 protein, partial [Machaerirhynchus nigripectus]|nr:PELP1 protein [Machaerirhynchus nigripectus]
GFWGGFGGFLGFSGWFRGFFGVFFGVFGVPEPGSGPPRAVRSRLYQVLELWVQVAGAASGVLQGPGTPGEVLLAHLISDISPPSEGAKVTPKPPFLTPK